MSHELIKLNRQLQLDALFWCLHGLASLCYNPAESGLVEAI
jgi:hypothetical protein